jgi:ankyrin repeat protein
VLADDSNATRQLLDQGADPNSRDREHGETALMLCRSDGVACLLLERGADVNLRDDRGETAFTLRPRPILLTAGADILATNAEGDTALHRAVASADLETVKWLCDNGADISSRNPSGQTLLSIARDYGLAQIAQCLKGAEDHSSV